MKIYNVTTTKGKFQIKARDEKSAIEKLKKIDIHDIDNVAQFSSITEILDLLSHDLADEHTAINNYRFHAIRCEELGYSEIADVLLDIAKEEEAHIGEVNALIHKICPESRLKFYEGLNEVKEMTTKQNQEEIVNER